MSEGLDILRSVATSLVGLGTHESREIQAGKDARAMWREFGLSARLGAVLNQVGPDEPTYAEHWRNILARCEAAVEIRPGGDAEHLAEYVRMIVVTMFGEQRDAALTDVLDEMPRLTDCAHAFYARFLAKRTGDYAQGVSDSKARVIAGCRLDEFAPGQLDEWLCDVDVFMAKCARHEYSRADALVVRAAIGGACERWISLNDNAVTRVVLAAVKRELARLDSVVERHALGPAHMLALEHQWRSYKYNVSIAPSIRNNGIGALQQHTVGSLRMAETFCWAPSTTQAVMASADGIPIDCSPTVSALGEIARVNRSGWWWFQEPLPIRTVQQSGVEAPVVALLWRYGLQDVAPPPDFPSLKPQPKLGMWFQTFIMHRDDVGGREMEVAIPTTAWIWHDGTTLAQLEPRLRREYQRVQDDGLMGLDSADIETTVEASVAFSRFFIAAAAWLRQKIVVETSGQGLRQAARQLQREHRLAETPRVRIVELRKSDYVRREDAPIEGASGRKLSVRFVVKGFWRQQWYATRKEHAPKYIESFLKGPADAPLKASAPTVFVVRR